MTHAETYWLEQSYWKDVRLNRNSFGKVSPGGALVPSLKLLIYMLDFCVLCVGVITKVSPRALRFCPKGFLNSALSDMSGRQSRRCKALNGVFFFCPCSFFFWSQLRSSQKQFVAESGWKSCFTLQTCCVKHIESAISHSYEHNFDSWWCYEFTCAAIFHQSVSINLMKHLIVPELWQLALFWVFSERLLPFSRTFK